jgi:Putative prokaryotic signal transducing protein
MSALVESPPPPVVDLHTGGGSDWVELMRARNDIDAHLIAGRLTDSGIEVRTIKDRSGPTWMFGGSDPWSPVAIMVKRIQYEDSRLVLAEVSYAAPAFKPPVIATAGWSPVTFWAVAIALGLLFTGIGLARSAEYIDRCGFDATCESTP